MRLFLFCVISINIGRNAMLCYICHVYSQDLNLFMVPSITPKSVILVRKISCSIYYKKFSFWFKLTDQLESEKYAKDFIIFNTEKVHILLLEIFYDKNLTFKVIIT